MTVISALVHKGTVYMGGDTQGTYAQTVRVPMSGGKVARVGDFIFGSCGSGRVGALLRAAFTPPTTPGNDLDFYLANNHGGSLDVYIATDFVGAIYDLLSKHHALCKETESGREGMGGGGALLVGVRSRLFLVDSYLCTTALGDPYFAIGSGGDVALGALYACLDDSTLSPADKVARSVAAAIKHVEGCGGEPTILELPPPAR